MNTIGGRFRQDGQGDEAPTARSFASSWTGCERASAHDVRPGADVEIMQSATAHYRTCGAGIGTAAGPQLKAKVVAIMRCALAIQGIEASGSRSSRTSKGPTTSALSTRQVGPQQHPNACRIRKGAGLLRAKLTTCGKHTSATSSTRVRAMRLGTRAFW